MGEKMNDTEAVVQWVREHLDLELTEWQCIVLGTVVQPRPYEWAHVISDQQKRLAKLPLAAYRHAGHGSPCETDPVSGSCAQGQITVNKVGYYQPRSVQQLEDMRERAEAVEQFMKGNTSVGEAIYVETTLVDSVVNRLLEEAVRLEKLHNLPPCTAQIKWEQDENGWPTKARMYIPQEFLTEENDG